MISGFVFVGAIGFIIDIVFFNILIYLGFDLNLARIFAFWSAASATWWGHRHISFKAVAGRKLSQWFKHFATCHVTGAVNLAIFYLSYSIIGVHISFILGIVVATGLNFTIGKYFTFNTDKTRTVIGSAN